MIRKYLVEICGWINSSMYKLQRIFETIFIQDSSQTFPGNSGKIFGLSSEKTLQFLMKCQFISGKRSWKVKCVVIIMLGAVADLILIWEAIF